MFGAVVPGFTSVLSNFQLIGENRFGLTIPHGNTPIQSLCISLLPGQNIPHNYGCSIYLSDNGQNWEYMGCLLNNKPSVLINPPLHYDSSHKMNAFGVFQQQQQQQQHQNILYVGIALEPLDMLKNLEEEYLRKEQNQSSQIVGLARYLAQNLFNYMSSFIKTVDNRDMIVLPPNALDNWLRKITSKLQNDPYFWKREI